jgi:pimeloyl-ACP methyl ester carboxylesterase
MMNTRAHIRLHTTSIGSGERIVLVHGSLATADDEWVAQHCLAEQGFELVLVDRYGYGQSPGPAAEDYLADADGIAELLGDGAHLVGHSYGGLAALFAAARRPAAVRSLTLLEPGLPAGITDDPSWRAFVASAVTMWEAEGSDEQWVTDFLVSVGSNPDEFPPEFFAAALPLVPLLRHGRRFFEADLPLAELRSASFPKLVVSGGHHDGFTAACRDLAVAIGGQHREVPGAGHEIQFVGEALNVVLVELWRHS